MYEEQNLHCYRGYLIGFLQTVVLGKLLGLRLSGEAHNNLNLSAVPCPVVDALCNEVSVRTRSFRRLFNHSEVFLRLGS